MEVVRVYGGIPLGRDLMSRGMILHIPQGGGLVTPQEIAPRFRVQEAGEGVYDPQEMLNQGLLIREDHI